MWILTCVGIDMGCESSHAVSHQSVNPIDRQETLHLDNDFLADFEWALGDDAMFGSTEPFTSTWSAAGNFL